jgi:transcriptional regulator GlxA family with amidase domain
LLIDGRQAQAPFIIPEAFSSGDELIARLAARVEAALPNLPKIGELAQEFCMSERTLARHVKRATGASTLALLQSIRIRRARALLESSRMTVEQVAAAVGYQDATALRRLMQRIAGANPSRFRPALVG